MLRSSPFENGVTVAPKAEAKKGDAKESKEKEFLGRIIWLHNDLSRGHPKWWFSKGIFPKWP